MIGSDEDQSVSDTSPLTNSLANLQDRDTNQVNTDSDKQTLSTSSIGNLPDIPAPRSLSNYPELPVSVSRCLSSLPDLLNISSSTSVSSPPLDLHPEYSTSIVQTLSSSTSCPSSVHNPIYAYSRYSNHTLSLPSPPTYSNSSLNLPSPDSYTSVSGRNLSPPLTYSAGPNLSPSSSYSAVPNPSPPSTYSYSSPLFHPPDGLGSLPPLPGIETFCRQEDNGPPSPDQGPDFKPMM